MCNNIQQEQKRGISINILCKATHHRQIVKKKKITFRDKYHPNILIMQTFRLPRHFSVLKNKTSTIGSRLFRASITLYYFLSHIFQILQSIGHHAAFLQEHSNMNRS